MDKFRESEDGRLNEVMKINQAEGVLANKDSNLSSDLGEPEDFFLDYNNVSFWERIALHSLALMMCISGLFIVLGIAAYISELFPWFKSENIIIQLIQGAGGLVFFFAPAIGYRLDRHRSFHGGKSRKIAREINRQIKLISGNSDDHVFSEWSKNKIQIEVLKPSTFYKQIHMLSTLVISCFALIVAAVKGDATTAFPVLLLSIIVVLSVGGAILPSMLPDYTDITQQILDREEVANSDSEDE